MVRKPTFESLFDAAASEFEGAFKRSALATRPDEVGGPREQQLRDFLTEWLPSIYGITHGYVIDIAGNISRQCDVMLYDALRTPKFIQDRATDRRLIPFGSLYGTIEVKSTLDESQLRDSLEKLKAVSKLRSTTDEHYFDPPLIEEREVLAFEVEREINRWGHSYRAPRKHVGGHRYVSDEEWSHYRIKLLPKDTYRSAPIGLIFAYRLAKDFTFEKAQDVMRALKFFPDGLVVLDSGFAVRSSDEALKRYKSIEEGMPISAYRFDLDIMRARLQNTDESALITKATTEAKYTLLFFYAYLLDLLAEQTLDEKPLTDFIAVWRKQSGG